MKNKRVIIIICISILAILTLIILGVIFNKSKDYDNSFSSENLLSDNQENIISDLNENEISDENLNNISENSIDNTSSTNSNLIENSINQDSKLKNEEAVIKQNNQSIASSKNTDNTKKSSSSGNITKPQVKQNTKENSNPKPKIETSQSTNAKNNDTQTKKEDKSTQEVSKTSNWCIEGGTKHLEGDGLNEHGYYKSWNEAENAMKNYVSSLNNSYHYAIYQCACGKYYFWVEEIK